MNKKLFLEGKPFKYKGQTYRLRNGALESLGFGEIWFYEVNLNYAKTKRISWFTYVMKKEVKGFVYYSEMELIKEC